jgi:hypothetical protein
MRAVLRLFAGLVLSVPVWALGLAELSNQDAVSGLKAALTQSSAMAVSKLGSPGGFLGNPRVRIPLPGSLNKAAGLMRSLGMGKYADELETTMNRAAEAAVPEGKAVLVDAVKKMTVQDAKTILTGGNDSATQYFKSTTSAALTAKFLPIVKNATSKVGLAQQYNTFAEQGAKLHLLNDKQASLEGYVTQKTLDGLFLMMAEEEKAIRQNPLGQTSKLVKKVFGAIGK